MHNQSADERGSQAHPAALVVDAAALDAADLDAAVPPAHSPAITIR